LRRHRTLRATGGTPIEEAPGWVLALLALILWLVVFPALVGLLNGLRLVSGGGWAVAAAAAAISTLLVAGLARQRPWRRATPAEPCLQPPVFVRLSTWLITTLIVPNVLFGVLVLSRDGEGLDYVASWLIGGLVSAIHGGFALVERRRRRRSAP
jgi:hypothetical protein